MHGTELCRGTLLEKRKSENQFCKLFGVLQMRLMHKKLCMRLR